MNRRWTQAEIEALAFGVTILCFGIWLAVFIAREVFNLAL